VLHIKCRDYQKKQSRARDKEKYSRNRQSHFYYMHEKKKSQWKQLSGNEFRENGAIHEEVTI
jgi:hypothetical protein